MGFLKIPIYAISGARLDSIVKNLPVYWFSQKLKKENAEIYEGFFNRDEILKSSYYSISLDASLK